MTDTMKLEARGDSVEKMEETISMDMAAFDEDTQKLMVEAYDSLVESYQAVDGVECTGTTTDVYIPSRSPLIPPGTRWRSWLSRDCFRWRAVRTESLWRRPVSHWKQAVIPKQNKRT